MGDTDGQQFDLFISHADADREWVAGYLLDALTAANITFHHEEVFTLGVPRLLEFERAVQQCRRTLLILSPAYLAEGFSHFADLLAQSYGLETATWPVIPLILHSVKLPPRLAMLTALDATDPDRWPQMLERLLTNLQRPLPPPPEKPSCPYPGMMPFQADEARNFFGREAEINDMLQRLRHQRFLVVIGDSGSGKSSLINAGLLPALTRNTFFAPGYWLVRTMNPGDQPLQNLRQVLDAELAEPALALTNLLTINPPAQRLLLIIDQFEELFTQASRPDQSQFIAALLALRATESCAMLIALRGDFFYTDLTDTDLWPVSVSERQEIAPLRGEALRDAIVKPAAREGVYLEPVLVERLLADAAEERGALPLIQETMVQLWGKMKRRFIVLDAYRQLGGGERSGLAGALVTKADATLDALTRRSSLHKTIAYRIFLRLVQFGEGRPDTRRQQPESTLHSWDDDPQTFDETLQHLADNRLLTLSGEGEDQDRHVDIAHEALFTEWPALKERLREWRRQEQMRRRLEDWATNWISREGDPKALLNPAELSQAEEWLHSPAAAELGGSKGLRDLVHASTAALRRARLVQFGTWAAIAGAIIVALAIGLSSSQRIARQEQAFGKEQAKLAAEARAKRDEAIQAKEIADTERQRADGLASDLHLRQLLLKSESLVNDRYDQALLLSIATYRQADTDATRANLLRVLRAWPQVVRYVPITDTSALLAFSPDGETLVALTQGGFRFWEAGTGAAVNPVSTVIDGRHVATRDGKTGFSSQQDTILSWDLTSRSEPRFLSGQQTDEISPDGKLMASWGKGGVVLKDVETGNQIGTLGDPFLEYGYNLTFSPDSKRLVAASDGPGEMIIDEVVFTWELQNALEEYAEYGERFSRDEADRLYFPVDDTSYRAYVADFVFSSDGRNLAANVSKHIDIHYQLGAGSTELWQGEAALTSLTSRCNGRFAVGRADGKIVFFDEDYSPTQPVFGHPGPVETLVLSADCRRMASMGGGVLVLWDLSATEKPATLTAISTPIATTNAAANASLGGWDFSGAVSGSGCSGQASQLYPDSPCVKSSIPGGYAGFAGIVTALAESPDGKTLAAGICSEYEFDLNDPPYHPDDCNTREVWVWLGGPDEGVRLEETWGSAVTELIFSPDGKALAAVDQYGSITVWDVDIESLISDACYKVGRNLTGAEWTLLTGYDQPDQPACPSTERSDPDRWAAMLEQLKPLLRARQPTMTPWPTVTPRPTRTPTRTTTTNP